MQSLISPLRYELGLVGIVLIKEMSRYSGTVRYWVFQPRIPPPQGPFAQAAAAHRRRPLFPGPSNSQASHPGGGDDVTGHRVARLRVPCVPRVPSWFGSKVRHSRVETGRKQTDMGMDPNKPTRARGPFIRVPFWVRIFDPQP